METKEGKQKIARVLVDSGGKRSIMRKDFAGNLKIRKVKHTRVFQTIAGLVKSNTYVNTKFTLPEFTDTRDIQWKF